ncbi:hypothetical protein [Bradyrhizobium sp. JYMT SZCCT0428]|uniref:hypothetical protein n=1 Tax=Bradyrhizobium sp. JYMT SZCCT0428 TaxID=2807673 RepID=UPI001BA6DA65|nr:hypothetical protein [Bradyrhizobium sp. JYMT SZCCT0428]MBR1153569.1 hypothetical protein [Bradyrhizobium sp. JYMT SZCCT0428]
MSTMMSNDDTRERQALRLVFHRVGNGLFAATYDGQRLCVSDTPLICSANCLLNAGHHPDTPIVGRWARCHFDNLNTTLSIAASGRFDESNVFPMRRRAGLMTGPRGDAA